MTQAAEAEAALTVLRTNLEELRSEITSAEAGCTDGTLSGEEVAQRAVLFTERITQDQIAADGIGISKSAAADALAAKDRRLAQKLSVLLARRKGIIRDLNGLAIRVEGLVKKE